MRADEREIVKMFLEEVSRDRNNNLNFLRLIAAVLVIICHAYPLSLGEDAIDILGRMTDGQIHLGGVAVCIFFFFSGFFLNRSVNKGYGEMHQDISSSYCCSILLCIYFRELYQLL